MSFSTGSTALSPTRLHALNSSHASRLRHDRERLPNPFRPSHRLPRLWPDALHQLSRSAAAVPHPPIPAARQAIRPNAQGTGKKRSTRKPGIQRKMIICCEGRPGQGKSYQAIRQIVNKYQEPKTKTMPLFSPTSQQLEERMSEEELIAVLLLSGLVTLVEAKMKARDRKLTIRIRKNARAAA